MKTSPWHILWSIPPFIFLFSFSVTTLVGWTIVWLLFLPFGRKLVRKGEDYLYATCGWVFAFFFHKWVRTEYVFYGDNLPNESENVILLSNHQCSVDWLILEFLTLRANAAGFTRYILKDVLRLVPVYGFMINRHGGIFVRRKGGRDKDNIHNALQKIADDKRPVWLCMFPEGTRYDSTKVTVMEKSKAFAKSHGLPPLKNVLTPRTTGFETVMEVGRKYFTSVYDVTIMYEAYEAIGNGNGKLTTPPNVFTFIGGACKRVHVHLHRKEMSELPEEPEQIKSWLYERYSEKDKILDTLSSTINTPNQPPPTASIPRANIPPISDLRLTLAFILGAGALLFHLLHSYGPWLWVVTLVTYSFLGIVIAYVPLPF